MSKLAEFILPTLLIAVFLVAPTISSVKASPDIVFSDALDGNVSSSGTAAAGTPGIAVGDAPGNIYWRGFFKFSLSGVSGTLSSARMYVYVFYSLLNGVQDLTDPLDNPGLGDCQVIHIDDYGTLDSGDFNAPSIGNDPGILVSGSATPNIGYLSIDVKAAMQDDINKGRSFSSFMIKMATDTDIDNLYDYWSFGASESAGTAGVPPYIEYDRAPAAVGGVFVPVNKLTILAPYLALIGLVGAVTVVFATKRRRKT